MASGTSVPSPMPWGRGLPGSSSGPPPSGTLPSPLAWSARYGSGRVAVAIDVRDGKAVGHGWTIDAASVDAAVAIERLADAGVETFEVTAIDRDGLLEGPDLALYERVVGLDLGDVIASGGISTIDDLRALRGTGCAGAIIGRALYDGRFTLDDAIGMSTERRPTS